MEQLDTIQVTKKERKLLYNLVIHNAPFQATLSTLRNNPTIQELLTLAAKLELKSGEEGAKISQEGEHDLPHQDG